jgi:glycosyltransferase involved in cell wall biosynthesis
VPVLTYTAPADKEEKFILYQGAVNEGRCFETLIPAMKAVNCKLVICGNGNFMAQAKLLAEQHKLEGKVIFKGAVEPSALRLITAQAYIGINLVENNGLSNYLSLANKFFDYIHAGIPQLCVDYPAYAEINDRFRVAMLTNDTSPGNLALLLNNLLNNEVLYEELKTNCLKAREYYSWQNEQKELIQFYRKLESRAN